jgi:hypothetical protein
MAIGVHTGSDGFEPCNIATLLTKDIKYWIRDTLRKYAKTGETL